MTNNTQTQHPQETAIARLERQGFRFANWIPADPDANGDPIGEGQVAVMVRCPNRFIREYREVEPDGTVY